MEIHEDFERGFERHQQDHDPFELMAVAPLLCALQRFEALAVMLEPIVYELEPLIDKLVIHDA